MPPSPHPSTAECEKKILHVQFYVSDSEEGGSWLQGIKKLHAEIQESICCLSLIYDQQNALFGRQAADAFINSACSELLPVPTHS